MVHGLHVTVAVQHVQPRSQGFFSLKYLQNLLHKSVKTACSSSDKVLIGHDSGIQEMFACGMRDPGLSNPAYSWRKPEFH